MPNVISKKAVGRHRRWVKKIEDLGSDFRADSSRVESELEAEVKADGAAALLDHLRLCSAIPESYGHDTTEEKLYSKYTDALLSATYRQLGLNSVVLTERADTADVEAVARDYSFVADAKVFRLSRTAKNQKDFKIQAMDAWKRGKPFAMVVCPLYQLPTRASQIYRQAAARNVCTFSYSHLAVLVEMTETEGANSASDLLLRLFKTVEAMNPTKEANAYWQAVNRSMLSYGDPVPSLWKAEKLATIESIDVSKRFALEHYAAEREAILNLSREEALKRLIKSQKIDSRIEKINSVSANSLMDIS